jgi:hypothetical protein
MEEKKSVTFGGLGFGTLGLRFESWGFECDLEFRILGLSVRIYNLNKNLQLRTQKFKLQTSCNPINPVLQTLKTKP